MEVDGYYDLKRKLEDSECGKTKKRRIELNIVPQISRIVPGKVYYLYKRPNGENYVSMLSPKDWNDKPPNEFVGPYICGEDFKWSQIF